MVDAATPDRTATLEEGVPRSHPPKRAWDDLPRRFEVLRELGHGGSAVVVEARDRVLGRRVALKRLHLRAGSAERLLREARMAASLEHEGIVRVYEVDVDHGLLVMELLEGGTLEDRIARGTLGAREVTRLGRALAAALAHAHRGGVLHRDVKPSNVVLDALGRPRLADFGIAAAIDEAPRAAGTRAYAAPEQLAGGASIASDLYGLGATLLVAATGKRPGAVAPERVVDEVRRATGSVHLARVIGRLLRTEPTARPASAAEVVASLERLERWRRPAALAGMASLLLLALVGLAVAGAFVGPAAPERASERQRAVADARAALGRADLDAAETALARADLEDAEAVSLSILVDWWRGRDTTELVDRLDRALAGELPPSDRELLEGLRLLGRHELDDAAAHFDAYVERRPEARDGLYGAFEAHWHRGEGELASALYDRILATDPDFALGIEHVLTHALATRRLDRVSSILASSDAVPTAHRVLWRARLDMARGAPDAAAEGLRRSLRLRPDQSARSYARIAWAQAEVARGDLAAARAVAEGADALTRAQLLHALASLDPGADLEVTRRALADALASHATGSFVTATGWLALELALGPRGDLAPALAAFARVRHDDVRTRMLDLAWAERRGDAAMIRAARASTSPEVAAAAAAIEAETEGDLAAAAEAWERAARASHDGSFRPVSVLRAASARASMGDSDAMAEGCSALRRELVPWSAFPLLAACEGR